MDRVASLLKLHFHNENNHRKQDKWKNSLRGCKNVYENNFRNLKINLNPLYSPQFWKATFIYGILIYTSRMSVVMYVAKDLVDRLTDMVFLYSEVSFRSREGV